LQIKLFSWSTFFPKQRPLEAKELIWWITNSNIS